MTNAELPEKKGMGTGAKVAIGCGAVAVVGVIVVVVAVVVGGLFMADRAKEAGFDTELMARSPGLAAARMMITANPDLDLVDLDEERGTLTIRNKETGETLTVDFRDIEEGRVTFGTEEGEVTFRGDEEGGRMEIRDEAGETQTLEIGTAPDPSRLPEWIPIFPGELSVGYTASDGTTRVGIFTIETTASRQEVRDYYVSQLEGRGFTAAVSSMEAVGMRMITVTSSDREGQRELTILINEADDKTTVTVNYKYEG